MVSRHLAKFGGHRYYGGEDIMLLVVEGKDSTHPHLYLQLLFIFSSQAMPCLNTKFPDVISG